MVLEVPFVVATARSTRRRQRRQRLGGELGRRAEGREHSVEVIERPVEVGEHSAADWRRWRRTGV